MNALMTANPLRAMQTNGAAPNALAYRGNIDLNNRPMVQNGGQISTVRSMSIGVDGKEVLIPTVSEDGRIMSDREAIDVYFKTGRHLGVFDSPQEATAYAERLHNQQSLQYLGHGGRR